MQQIDWNWCTKGDVCESIMGVYYEWSVLIFRARKSPEVSEDRFGGRLKLCSDLIEYFVWHTYQLQQEVGQEQMLPWVHWIYRRGATGSLSTLIPHVYPHEQDVAEPKMLCLCHLIPVLQTSVD